MIARITHSCQLVPKGMYKAKEDNPNAIELAEEFALPEVAEMASLDNWSHYNPHILLQGRATYYFSPQITEDQRGELSAELEAKDPMVEILKGISDDKPYEALGYTANWTVQICGESIPVNSLQEGKSNIYGVALLRNLVWPGACTVGYKGGWTSIYIGYGHRVSQGNNLVK